MKGLLVALLAAGCGSVATEPAPDLRAGPLDFAVDEPDLFVFICNDNEVGDAGVQPAFHNVEKVFDSTCSNELCHSFTNQEVNLGHGLAYAGLVGQPAPDSINKCGGLLVAPGDPGGSYLMVKLTLGLGMQCNPTGSLMPIGEPFSMGLPPCELDLIRRWISAGAPND